MILIIYSFICFINFYVCVSLINKIISNNKKIIIIKDKINMCYLNQFKDNNKFRTIIVIVCHIIFFAVNFNVFFIKIRIKYLVIKIILVLLCYLFFYYLFGYGLLNTRNKKEYLLIILMINIYTLLIVISNDKTNILIEGSIIFKILIQIGYGILYIIFMKKIILSAYAETYKGIGSFYIYISYLLGIVYILFLGSCIIEIYYKGSYSGITSYFDLFYYTIVTFATIGFGDVVPCVFESKIMSVIIAITSIITISSNLSIILEKGRTSK